MKKGIYLFLTVVLSLFVFSGEVHGRTAMYKKCNYVDECTHDWPVIIPYDDFVDGLCKFNILSGICNAAGDKLKTLLDENGFDFDDDGNIVYNINIADDGNLLNYFLASKRPDISTYVTLTDSSGAVKVYGLGSNGGVYNLDDDSVKKTDFNGCWIKDFTKYSALSFLGDCNSSNAFDVSNQTINSNDSCPSCILSEKATITDWESFLEIYQNPALIFGGAAIIAADIVTEEFLSSTESWEYVPAGDGGKVMSSSSSYIEQTEYVVYKYENNGKVNYIAEGYAVDENNGGYGVYSFVGPNIYSIVEDDILSYQISMLNKLGKDFWRVHDKFESRMISLDTNIFTDSTYFGVGITNSGWWKTVENVCQNGEQDCINNHGYETIISSSSDYNSARKKIVEEWYSDALVELNVDSSLVDIVNQSDMIKTCETINSSLTKGKSYSLSDEDAEDLVDYLEDAFNALNHTYDFNTFPDYCTGTRTEPIDSLTSYFYKKKISNDMCEMKDLATKKNNRYYFNTSYLVAAIQRDLKKSMNDYLKESNEDTAKLISIIDNMDDYITTFYTTVAILESNGNLDQSLIDRLSILKTDFAELVEEKDIDFQPILDCEGLIGQKLIDKIRSYLNIVRIAIPILLIGFGIYDFTKVLFSSDDDAMNKVKKTFFKRIGISILIFLTPTIVNLILTIANEVWPIIVPSACGIFD